MKNFLFITALFFLLSCSVTYKIGSEGEKYKLPEKLSAFLNSFEQSVTLHDSNKLLSYMDKAYKKEQHDEMLEGRTEQFLNEFFSGTNVDGSGFVLVKFSLIRGIYFTSIQQNETGYSVYYTVKTKDVTVDCNWEISVTKTEDGTVYGFVGAVG